MSDEGRTIKTGQASATQPAPTVPASPARAGRRRRRKGEENIEPGRFPTLSWADGDMGASLEAVYQWVVDEGMRVVAWYLREKKSKARWSRWLRIAAILFATAGAALPFIAANNGVVDFEWGYVLLALAAGAVAMDRYFGLSTAWMRYIKAEQAIQRRLQELQFEWASTLVARGNRELSPHEVAAELQKLAAVAEAIGEEVRSETRTWTDEFQSNMGDLQHLAGRSET